ncbi:hypothetical protein [Jidongwangia harbinensis]|uniref:hypothetical protein n=1 Tax=Jidongwangia harbinensis TaxID=2878561 RepID=UPI001CD91A1F|nr:hypothetical protein [Jidongwangia harbinensis]MCA2212367.1 hypothetical protein [Jidongwangia harbinensis]
MISLVMFGLSGLLVGGVVLLVRQDRDQFRILVTALAAVLCAACGLSYLGES